MSIEESLRREADDVYGWSNGPGDRYARHSHAYTKVLSCVSGSIDFVLDDRVIHLGYEKLTERGSQLLASLGFTFK